jgi:hypothetical protein
MRKSVITEVQCELNSRANDSGINRGSQTLTISLRIASRQPDAICFEMIPGSRSY